MPCMGQSKFITAFLTGRSINGLDFPVAAAALPGLIASSTGVKTPGVFTACFLNLHHMNQKIRYMRYHAIYYDQIL